MSHLEQYIQTQVRCRTCDQLMGSMAKVDHNAPDAQVVNMMQRAADKFADHNIAVHDGEGNSKVKDFIPVITRQPI